MKRVGLKLLLCIAITSALQRAVAKNESDSNAPATSQKFLAPVTNVAQLRALSRADLNRGRPVSLTGIVTLIDNDRRRLVLQDATGAVMWYSDKPIDTALERKTVRIACANACTYATTFPDFPFRPSGADIQSSFAAPSNWGDCHLTRMAAHLSPPKSGEYRFWIASDDSSELWLSADEDPTHVRKIAAVMEGFWTDPNEWDRFPSQRSEPIYLRSDKSYYIEAFQEQGYRDDHLSVAWEGPGIERSVIPGQFLTPWSDDRAAMSEGNNSSKGVLREYWTNYAVGSLAPIMPVGPADAPLAGRNASFQIIGSGTLPEPRVVDLREPLLPENNFRWIQTEGIITFVSTNGASVTLELAAGSKRASARIAQANQNWLHAIRNWHVQVQGVCEGATDANGELNLGVVWVLDPGGVRLLEPTSVQKESIAPPGLPMDVTTSSGGFYSASGAVMFDGRFSGRRYLYIQDIGGSVCVSDADRLVKDLLEVGQRVQVGGTVSPGKVGFHLVPRTMRLLGWQSLPLPEEVSEETAYRDGQWTEVEGVVHSIRSDGVMRVKGTGGFVSVWIPMIPRDNSLVDSSVRIRGVISLDTQDSPLLLVGSRDFFQIEEEARKDPFSLPICRISSLDHLSSGAVRLHRVKVEGTVTYVSESAVYLQDDSGAVHLQAGHPPSAHPGDRLEVIGFQMRSVPSAGWPNRSCALSAPDRL